MTQNKDIIEPYFLIVDITVILTFLYLHICIPRRRKMLKKLYLVLGAVALFQILINTTLAVAVYYQYVHTMCDEQRFLFPNHEGILAVIPPRIFT